MSLAHPTSTVDLAEVNPPLLPSGEHERLEGRWRDVLVTDNPFRQVRISPYAYAARITHDIPGTRPTVVCSTRDRNMLAIESEVRGALGNGVRSFLVVQGDVLPEVEHWSDAYEIVELLAELHQRTVPFEIGMSVPARRSQVRRRTDLGAQFLVCGPVVDPTSVDSIADRLALQAGDPPIYLSVVPPFSAGWTRRLVDLGAVAPGPKLAGQLANGSWSRARAWASARDVRQRAAGAGFAGTVLMGCRFETLVEEAFWEWRRPGDGQLAGEIAGARGVPPLPDQLAAGSSSSSQSIASR